VHLRRCRTQEDIHFYCAFLKEYTQRTASRFSARTGATKDLVEVRLAGNVRELDHAIERAVLMSTVRASALKILPFKARWALPSKR